MDCGCGSSAADCTAPLLCPGLPQPVPYPLPASVVSGAEGVTCGPDASASDFARLEEDSPASPDGDYTYPDTMVTGWLCTQSLNAATPGGMFFLSRVQSSSAVYCSTCASEQIYGPAATLVDGGPVSTAMIDALTQGCIARHH
jgi:hypothetical protein